MQRILIVLVVGLLSVGCEKMQDQVVGIYEFKNEDGDTLWQVYLDNGVYEEYRNGKKTREEKWSIIDHEIYVEYGDWKIVKRRRNPDGSITTIQIISPKKNKLIDKKDQPNYKKIK